MTTKLYLPAAATLEKVVEETSNIKTFTFRPLEPLAFQAGQFVELTLPGLGEAPFTPSSSPAIAERMDITIMRVGAVTEKIHSLATGAVIGIRGPLGKPYPLDKFQGREILIVGGGVGLAPLRALLFALFDNLSAYKKIAVRYGARTPADIVYAEALKEAWGQGDKLDAQVTVDKGAEGWTGNEGVVTTLLEPDKLPFTSSQAVAVVCGPPIMMKFSTLKLLEIGFNPAAIFLSMEKNMSCGVGKCGHCRIDRFYACQDGPVFAFDQIKDFAQIWE